MPRKILAIQGRVPPLDFPLRYYIVQEKRTWNWVATWNQFLPAWKKKFRPLRTRYSRRVKVTSGHSFEFKKLETYISKLPIIRSNHPNGERYLSELLEYSKHYQNNRALFSLNFKCPSSFIPASGPDLRLHIPEDEWRIPIFRMKLARQKKKRSINFV